MNPKDSFLEDVFLHPIRVGWAEVEQRMPETRNSSAPPHVRQGRPYTYIGPEVTMQQAGIACQNHTATSNLEENSVARKGLSIQYSRFLAPRTMPLMASQKTSKKWVLGQDRLGVQSSAAVFIKEVEDLTQTGLLLRNLD